MSASNYRSHKDAAWSYNTMIRQTLPNGITIGNTTKYSVTTSKHQNKEGVRSCHVLVDRVHEGCSNLERIALERGLMFKLEYEVTKAVLEQKK